MMMLVSSVELLTLYVALELTSYSLYLLVPLEKGTVSPGSGHQIFSHRGLDLGGDAFRDGHALWGAGDYLL